jgi:hypothetical protein
MSRATFLLSVSRYNMEWDSFSFFINIYLKLILFYSFSARISKSYVDSVLCRLHLSPKDLS